jgi:hypothetical protein
MKLALLLLLLAVSRPAVLTDDIYQVPAGEWRWVRFEIGHRPAVVECRFETVGSGEAVAELVSRADLELIHQHKIHDSLAATDTAPKDSFSQYIGDPGEYAVVIENPGSTPLTARLTVALSFGQPASRYLSRERQLTVILVSSAVFFAIVTFSARALLKAMKRQPQ